MHVGNLPNGCYANVISAQHHANISKQTVLDGIDVGLPKWGISGCDLNRSVHEGMNDMSNVKVHLKTDSGNVITCIHTQQQNKQKAIKQCPKSILYFATTITYYTSMQVSI